MATVTGLPGYAPFVIDDSAVALAQYYRALGATVTGGSTATVVYPVTYVAGQYYAGQTLLSLSGGSGGGAVSFGTDGNGFLTLTIADGSSASFGADSNGLLTVTI